MAECWDEYAENVRRNIYWLNMDLLHWNAIGDMGRVQDLKQLLEANHRILDREQHSSS